MKKVYFDSAATTQLRGEVILCMSEVLKTEYGNPSSTHSYGRSSKSLLENARKEIASYFKVSAAEIIFTSGGTEADNLILNSCVRDLGVNRIISSKIEHHAVLHTMDQLRAQHGITLDYVKLDAKGHVDYKDLERLLAERDSKTLVSLSLKGSGNAIREASSQCIDMGVAYDNEIKEKELKLKEEQIARGEKVENSDNSLVNEKKGSYTSNPGDKARSNKGAIGIDRDANF